MYMRHTTFATACETTVARAAPGIPQPRTIINTGSNTVFSISPKARRYVGRWLSPSARMRFVCIAKNIISAAPPYIMLIKETASSRISGGVCIRTSSGRAESHPRRVNTSAITRVSSAHAAALRRTPRESLAPNRCPVHIERPVVVPIMKPIMRNIRLPVQPTAASA